MMDGYDDVLSHSKMTTATIFKKWGIFIIKVNKDGLGLNRMFYTYILHFPHTHSLPPSFPADRPSLMYNFVYG